MVLTLIINIVFNDFHALPIASAGSNRMETTQVAAETLNLGALIEVGGKAHRITALRDYPKFGDLCPGHTARLADCDTGLGITLVDGSTMRVPA